MIHPAAVVEDGASLGEGVEVGPFAVIEGGAEVGDGCVIAAHAVIRRGVRLGPGCRIDSFAVIGGDPNHLGFDRSIPSGVEIGAHTVLRESVTVHRSIEANGSTRIGEGCFLMAGSHAAHDCSLGGEVVLANNVLLAGHVSVGARSFLGGGAAIHQFIRIGEGAMVAGLARITKDIAPYLLVGERDEVAGLNLTGLRRRKVPAEAVRELKALYQAILRSPGNPVETGSNREPPVHEEGRRFLEFFIPSKRGYAKNLVS
ncbi:MAG: acyl-ACP--UDP-N-acetylglucosamine O-acyltransferase [Puniceicoccaceae bacterium]